MPNFFTKSGASRQPASTKTRDSTSSISQLGGGDLGFFQGMMVRNRERKGRANVAITKLDAIEEEAKATTKAIVRMQGAELRAESARVHATTLGAIGAEVVRNHQVVHLELSTARFGGSLENIDNRNDMIEAVAARAKEGTISAEDARALIETARALHSKVEESIDEKYEHAAELIDGTFNLATASAKSILEAN